MDNPRKKKIINRNLAAVFLQIAAIFLLTPVTSLAQVPYAIDGNVPDADCCATFQDPVGSIKELGPVNASNTKLGSIHTASPPMLDFTNPNSSTDLATIWLETKQDQLGDIWLYFAWERESNSGSSVVSYELQTASTDPACDFSAIDQAEPASAEEEALINACNPWGNRQPGDFMVVWDFGGGSTDIILRTFDGATFDAGINLSASGFAVAALNADTSRGEGAINLTDAIFGTRDACFNIANVIPGTITGNSDQADYKDTVLADIASVVTISNCGTVNITKSTQPAGETGTFAYTLQRLGGGDIDYTPRTSASGTLIDDGGTAQLIVIPGTDYQLTEDLTGEPNFELQSIRCNKPGPGTDGMSGFHVNIAETTDCVITNELLTGTITVSKQVVNGYGGTAQASDFCLALNDDEGTPAQYTTLIEDGILTGYMQDRQNARLMGMTPTGNGRRESYAHIPMPRMTNTYMLSGEHAPEEILRSVKKGLYAVQFGGGQVDITSGKFVFSCTEAYLVENGKVGPAVKGATLIGNGPDVMTKVTMIGNDMALDTGIGTCGKDGQGVPVGVGQPTMLIDGLTVGGTAA